MAAGPLAIKAVLLDLDGTLLDTVLDLHAAANGMQRDLGQPEVAVEEIRAYVGRGIPNLVKRVLAGALEAADDPTRFAHDLYANLRALDASAGDRILVEAVPEGLAWQAVADRLRRAATGSGAG